MKLAAQGVFGGALLAGVVFAALLALAWTPYDPLAVDLAARLQAPSESHWLGTDAYGRDVASRAMAAAATSCAVALLSVLGAVTLGTVLGMLAGFLRGTTERVLMSLNDALLAFPGILLALAVMVVAGPGRAGIVAALALAYLPTVARVVRASVISLRERDWVEASRMIGNPEPVTLLRHVLPHGLGPVVVLSTSLFGWVLLTESALSFLGLGVPPPAPSWGGMLAEARSYLSSAAWLGVVPGLCIAWTLLGVNLLGDAVRDRLDPRTGAR